MTHTKKIVSIILGALGLVVLSSFATIGILSLRDQKQPAVDTPPPPPPAPVAVVEPPAPPVPPAPQMAQVVSVNPHYVTVSKPHKQCYQKPETIYTQAQPQNTPPVGGALVGGVAGGLAGSAVKGKHHTAAIVAGAALGALTGGAVQNNMNQPQPQPQTVYTTKCNTKYVDTKVKKGYEVVYFYNGVQGMVLMDNPPVSNMIPPPYQAVNYQPAPAPVAVSVAPAAAVAPAPVANTAG